MKLSVVPLVVGALGAPAKALEKKFKTLGIETKITELQESVLIHTSTIHRKVLEVWGVLLTPHLKNKTYPLVETSVRSFNNDNNSNCYNNNDDNNNNINNNKNNNNNSNENNNNKCKQV